MKPLKLSNDVEYEVVDLFLSVRKKYLDIREWVEMQDLYVNEMGDIYYVELYNTEYRTEEGHGRHEVIDSQEPVEYKILLSGEYFRHLVEDRRREIMQEEAEEVEPSKLAWAVIFVSLILLAWVFLWVVQPQ